MADTQEKHEDDYIVEDTDYPKLIERITEHTKLMDTDKGRFVAMGERKKESVYSVENCKNICHGKYMTSWRGANLMKDPFDIIIYQQVLWHEKPQTIIEIGSYTGASAMWLADISKINGMQCHVYSVDINTDLLHPAAKEHPGVTFIQGDVLKIAEAYPTDMLKSLPHPWLVIEDVHLDLIGVMEHFHKFMEPGDYFLIEDTYPDSPAICGQGLFAEDGFSTWGIKKHTVLEKFMAKHKELYSVDTYYCDFFGYNGTYNWNGYIKRMK